MAILLFPASVDPAPFPLNTVAPGTWSALHQVQYAKTLEGDFKGVASDFLWMLMMGGSLLMFLNHVTGLGLPFLTIPLIFMSIWVWYVFQS